MKFIFPLAMAFAISLATSFAEKERSPEDPAWMSAMARLVALSPSNSPGERAVQHRKVVEIMNEFIAENPGSPNESLARSIRAQSQFESLQSGDEGVKLDEIRSEFLSLANSPDTPAKIMGPIRNYLLRIAMLEGSASDVDKACSEFEVVGYIQDMPVSFLRDVATRVESVNPSHAGSLRAVADEVEKKQAALAAERESQAAAMQQLVGKPLDLSFEAVDGTAVDLASLKGKVVLVDFWATWCGPCMKEVPEVVKAYAKYKDAGFEIVGISFDQNREDLLRVTKEKGMTWPQYFDGKGWENVLGKQYGIRAIPRMWLVDRNGILVDVDGRDGFEKKLTKLLNDKQS